VNDADRFRLLGKYRTPRFRYRRIIFCEVRSDIRIVGLTDAPIPWAVVQRVRTHSLVVFKELARLLISRRTTNAGRPS
jgi:hypothetical protein